MKCDAFANSDIRQLLLKTRRAYPFINLQMVCLSSDIANATRKGTHLKVLLTIWPLILHDHGALNLSL